MSHAAELKKIEEVKKSHPENLSCKFFDTSYFNSLKPDMQDRLIACARSGFENPDSGVGAYAMQPTDYDDLKPYMDKVVRAYHKVAAGVNHVNDWSVTGSFDLSKLGLSDVSMRVRVGRNVTTFPLPGAMTKDDRINFEKMMTEKVFDRLKALAGYGGHYHSLTPGHPDKITDATYNELVKAHIMFKDMAADPYLASAGIAKDWPYGRGCYVSEDKNLIVWVGEEDQLRIMCMQKGTQLNAVFDRLKGLLDKVEQNIKEAHSAFAHSHEYGYITSCPTNLGTGMRASVHIKVPNLTKGGSDEKAKVIAKQFGLSVRGMGGEHTPIGADGTIDLSPSSRFGIMEKEIIGALYNGITLIMEAEAQEKDGSAGSWSLFGSCCAASTDGSEIVTGHH